MIPIGTKIVFYTLEELKKIYGDKVCQASYETYIKRLDGWVETKFLGKAFIIESNNYNFPDGSVGYSLKDGVGWSHFYPTHLFKIVIKVVKSNDLEIE